MKFIIASNNKKKLEELERILLPLGIDAVTAKASGINLEEVEETGATFEENAFIKAKAAHDKTGLGAIADDSGLCVDALGGAPGVFSARYSGGHGNDEDNNNLLLKNLKDVPVEKRTGRYVSAICCVMPDGSHFTVKGECEGTIGFERSGTGGFGYDPLFVLPNGVTMANLTPEQKDEVSHRGKALRLLKEKLTELSKKGNENI